MSHPTSSFVRNVFTAFCKDVMWTAAINLPPPQRAKPHFGRLDKYVESRKTKNEKTPKLNQTWELQLLCSPPPPPQENDWSVHYVSCGIIHLATFQPEEICLWVNWEEIIIPTLTWMKKNRKFDCCCKQISRWSLDWIKCDQDSPKYTEKKKQKKMNSLSNETYGQYFGLRWRGLPFTVTQ